jgi:hypothetical protein
MSQENESREAAIRWLKRRLSVESEIVSAKDLIAQASETPEFWINDIDEAYREGFEEGFDYCIERVEALYRKNGFTRVREIVNILLYWSQKALRPWRYFGCGKFKEQEVGDLHHPIHHQDESWAQIRERILRRDKSCARCGDVLRLEVDHIIEVQDGGLPTDNNLRVLCKVCHNGKSIWQGKGR